MWKYKLISTLRVTLTPNLSWNEHISNIIAKANKYLFIMKAFKYRISRQALITYSFVYSSNCEYGDLLFDSSTKAFSDMIEEIQLEAARTATGAKWQSSHATLYFELGWISLYDKRKMDKMCKLYTIPNHLHQTTWVTLCNLIKLGIDIVLAQQPILFN